MTRATDLAQSNVSVDQIQTHLEQSLAAAGFSLAKAEPGYIEARRGNSW